MYKFTKIDKQLLSEILPLHKIEQGSFNIRKNGESVQKFSTEDVQIVPKVDKNGIDVFVKAGVKNKSVHIPVIITEGNLTDLVYNDFYIGEDAQVLIVAGCGIHNTSKYQSQHDGTHTLHLEENSQVKYIERHIGMGDGSGEKVLNPITIIDMKKNSKLEMETVQLSGVTSSKRKTKAVLGENAKLVIKEKILTEHNQTADTMFEVLLKGKNSSAEVISRSVAKGHSKQKFFSNLIGHNECFGHVECDGIVLNKAQVQSIPKIFAKSEFASLVHEAAIGKIAGEQLIKLQTLGLTEQQAQDQIIKGFLK